MIVKGNSSSRGALEGSKISFYCHDNESQLMMEATCMSSSNWNPNPNLFKCHHDTGEKLEGIIKELSNVIFHYEYMSYNCLPTDESQISKMTLYVLVAMIVFITIVMVVLFMLSTVIVLKGIKRWNHNKAYPFLNYSL